MKKSTRIRLFTMILVVILMVITMFSSCSADNSSPILCNVKLDYDNSRDFSNLSLVSDLNNYSLLYKATYLGNGSKYGATIDYVSYPDGGLILSQGLWQIDCKWMKGDTLIAEGTTRDIWVNLNTSSILVYLEENVGKGSFSLESYKVKCSDNSVSSVSYDISLCKYTESLGSNLLSTSEYKTGKETGCISTLNITKNDLEAGAYLLTIKVFNGNTQTTENLLFTDVLGFLVREGHQTTIEGDCEVKKGTTSSNSEYMDGYYDDEKNQPIDSNKVIPVGETTTKKTNLSTEVIQNNHIYVVNESTTNSGSMNLGHSESGSSLTNQSDRMITPEPEDGKIDFGINLNGTNVVVTTYSPKWYELVFNSEQTTIISLKSNVTMNLYNNVEVPDLENPAVWGVGGEFKRRYHSNVSLEGGSLNVIGPSSNGISNEPIIFRGPQYFDSNDVDTAGGGEYYKQGTINVSSPGGKIVFDGKVTIEGSIGVSSWNADKSATSTLTGTSDFSFTLKNNARIESIGDTGFYPDTAHGIFMKGSNTTDNSKITILLDSGHISTSCYQATDANECGIKITDFAGDISITISNGSTILTSGTGIYLNNCTGNVSISVSDSTITANTPLIITGNRPKTLSLNGINE